MKKNKIILCISVLLLFLSSCMTTKDFNNYMNQWKGLDEDQLYLVYGPPMRSQVLKDGRKLIAYDYQYSGLDGVTFCEVNFTVEGTKITDASYKGDYPALVQHLQSPNSRRNP
ncbi:MAG: hypothetical protein ACI35Z_02205 [Sphingobacterium hotanense]